MVYQIFECANRFSILLQELTNFRSDQIKKWSVKMWNILQDILESVVSEHLDIWQHDSDKNRKERSNNTKTLFSFENTNFVASAISSYQKKVLLLKFLFYCKKKQFDKFYYKFYFFNLKFYYN